jgi:hypothetical protein
MRNIFNELDADNSGCLDRAEISELLLDIFGNISHVRMAHLIKLFDPLGAGCTYEMFVKVLYDGNTSELSHQIVEQETRRELMRRKSSLTKRTSKLFGWLGGGTNSTTSKRHSSSSNETSAVELTEVVSVRSRSPTNSSIATDDSFESVDEVGH